MTLNLKLWKDILKETDPTGQKSYSQARVYLLFSVIAYYITLGLVTWKALKPAADIKEDTLKTIIEALQWALLLFAGYAFGGKVIEGFKAVMGKTIIPQQSTQDATENSNEPTAQ